MNEQEYEKYAKDYFYRVARGQSSAPNQIRVRTILAGPALQVTIIPKSELSQNSQQALTTLADNFATGDRPASITMVAMVVEDAPPAPDPAFEAPSLNNVS